MPQTSHNKYGRKGGNSILKYMKKVSDLKIVMLPILKKNNGRNCNQWRTMSWISHWGKILMWILNWCFYFKVERELEEEQFGFRKGKDMRGAIGLLWTISKRYLEKDKIVYIGFVDLGKAFHSVDWSKLMDSEEKWCGLKKEEALK